MNTIIPCLFSVLALIVFGQAKGEAAMFASFCGVAAFNLISLFAQKLLRNFHPLVRMVMSLSS